MKYKEGLILILILVELLVASYIAYGDLTHTEGVCLTGASCGIVQGSEYGSLFGLKVSYFGLISFIFLLGIWYATHTKKIDRKYFVYTTFLGSIFAIYFISIQFLVLKTVCFNCMILDTIMILITIIAATEFYKK